MTTYVHGLLVGWNIILLFSILQLVGHCLHAVHLSRSERVIAFCILTAVTSPVFKYYSSVVADDFSCIFELWHISALVFVTLMLVLFPFMAD